MPGPEVVRRNFRQYDNDLGLPGQIAPNPMYGGTANTTLTASTLYVSRFHVSRPMTITLIGFSVSTVATANDSVDVGIFDAAGNRLVSSGATAGKVNAGTNNTISVTATTLVPGTYLAGFAYGVVGGTAAALVSHVSAAAAAKMFTTGSFPNQIQGTYAATATLPASITLNGATSGGNCPILAIRES